jgi:hypothetical protein
VSGRCSDDDLRELYCFAHRLVGPDVGIEERFNEHLQTLLHLHGYSQPLAKHTLLCAQRWLDGLGADDKAGLALEGHAAGALLMAAVTQAHGSGRLMRATPNGLGVTLPAVAAAKLTLKALTGGADEAAASAALSSYESCLVASRRELVSSWVRREDVEITSRWR